MLSISILTPEEPPSEILNPSPVIPDMNVAVDISPVSFIVNNDGGKFTQTSLLTPRSDALI